MLICREPRLSAIFSRYKAAALILLCFILLSSSCAGGDSPENAETVPEGYGEGGFFALIMDTGKSDCSILSFDGVTVMIDAADEDDSEAITAALESMDITKIDYLIFTHYDKDHIGGAGAVISGFEIGQVLMPDYESTSWEYLKLIGSMENAALTPTIISRDMSVETAHGGFDISAAKNTAYKDENNYSLIINVRYDGHNLLFAGDALRQRTAEYISDCPASLDFIKLPHHGDFNRVLGELLAKTKPLYAVATIYERAELAPKLLDALDGCGARLLCTCDGAVTLTIQNGVLECVQTPSG